MIAVGLNTLGCSAAGVSFASMAAIFGTAGLGLGGYRMHNRTKALTDCEFQKYDESQVCFTV